MKVSPMSMSSKPHKILSASRRALAVFLPCLLLTLAVRAEEVDLDWEPSDSPDVAGYMVYYGKAPGTYTQVMNVAANTEAAVTNLDGGQDYYFTVTAYDAAGNESLPSNEAKYITPGISTVIPSGDGYMNVRFAMAIGHLYGIEASTDLQNWELITWSYGAANTWDFFTDYDSADFDQRFYRLVTY